MGSPLLGDFKATHADIFQAYSRSCYLHGLTGEESPVSCVFKLCCIIHTDSEK